MLGSDKSTGILKRFKATFLETGIKYESTLLKIKRCSIKTSSSFAKSDTPKIICLLLNHKCLYKFRFWPDDRLRYKMTDIDPKMVQFRPKKATF